ncbi:MAG TPA: alpha-ketoglutarate-dependent dioxygenase AlkB [Methylococcaceae bacterium]|nr:alpha-ketoglutarate-dependent dioxygenase AlkB [Methylococcaceae bacterium]
MPLFDSSALKNLAPRDGDVFLLKQYYSSDEANELFAILFDRLVWQEESIWMFGKPVNVPRLTCWYGDPDAVYSYSGVKHEPLSWTAELNAIRQRIQSDFAYTFNSVLANLYRSGQDSMGYHADNEKELGINPAIASLSLGDERLFRLVHNKSKEKLDLALGHGDLLIMAGSLQHHWRHAVPKTGQFKSSRINLTFREIKGVK